MWSSKRERPDCGAIFSSGGAHQDFELGLPVDQEKGQGRVRYQSCETPWTLTQRVQAGVAAALVGRLNCPRLLMQQFDQLRRRTG